MPSINYFLDLLNSQTPDRFDINHPMNIGPIYLHEIGAPITDPYYMLFRDTDEIIENDTTPSKTYRLVKPDQLPKDLEYYSPYLFFKCGYIERYYASHDFFTYYSGSRTESMHPAIYCLPGRYPQAFPHYTKIFGLGNLSPIEAYPSRFYTILDNGVICNIMSPSTLRMLNKHQNRYDGPNFPYNAKISKDYDYIAFSVDASYLLTNKDNIIKTANQCIQKILEHTENSSYSEEYLSKYIWEV